MVVFAAYMAMTIYKGFQNPAQPRADEEDREGGALVKGKLCRRQGITLLGIYGAFVVLQVLIALKMI